MSTIEAQPITTLPAPAEPAKTTEQAAQDAVLTGAGPQIVADENTTPATATEEAKTTTTIKEHEVKASKEGKESRNPLGNILNHLFPKKEGKVSKPAAEKPVASEITPEPVATEAEAPVATDVAAETPAPTTEAESTPAKVEEKPRTPSKKRESFAGKFWNVLADKKEKSPKKTKEAAEPTKAEETPVVASEEAPSTATLPDPVPQVVATEAETAKAIVEAPATSEPVITSVPAIEESKPAEPATTDDKPVVDSTKKEAIALTDAEKDEQKKKTKIGRRLSAKWTGLFSTSPKKEKTNPIEEKTVEETPVSEEAESSGAAAAVKEEAAVEETPKVEEIKSVEEPVKAEEPVTAVPLIAETTKEPVSAETSDAAIVDTKVPAEETTKA